MYKLKSQLEAEREFSRLSEKKLHSLEVRTVMFACLHQLSVQGPVMWPQGQPLLAPPDDCVNKKKHNKKYIASDLCKLHHQGRAPDG